MKRNCERFRTQKNSVPVNIVHASTLEVVWTIVSGLVLMVIAIPSFALLYAADELVDPAMTIKVVGHQWYWSYEYSDYETDDGKTNWEPGGQRMITVIAYLNDVEEGGGTSFPKLEVTIPAKKGNVVVFHNALESISTTHPKVNPRSLHAGMPVIKGEKWMTNLWFREKLRY